MIGVKQAGWKVDCSQRSLQKLLWLMFCQEQAEQSTNSSLTLEQKLQDQAAQGSASTGGALTPFFIIFKLCTWN